MAERLKEVGSYVKGLGGESLEGVMRQSRTQSGSTCKGPEAGASSGSAEVQAGL